MQGAITTSDRVAFFPAPKGSAALSGELGRMLDILREEFPRAAKIRFEFDARLLLQIDVRSVEDAALVEARLPALEGGIYIEARRGRTPGHSFLQRVTAFVVR